MRKSRCCDHWAQDTRAWGNALPLWYFISLAFLLALTILAPICNLTATSDWQNPRDMCTLTSRKAVKQGFWLLLWGCGLHNLGNSPKVFKYSRRAKSMINYPKEVVYLWASLAFWMNCWLFVNNIFCKHQRHAPSSLSHVSEISEHSYQMFWKFFSSC